MTQEGVKIEGLKELTRALSKVNKGAAAELRKELRTSVGGSFVRDVQLRIELVRLVKSGDLRRSIKPSVRGADVVIRSSPALKPGRKSPQGYAAVYEYGHGGRRAFLEPVREVWLATGKLKKELSGYLDWIAEEFRA